MKIVMMGPQGSGKGTQAKLLSDKLRIPHISTGDLLREEVAGHTGLGRALEGIMDAGRLVPDEVILYITERRLSRDDCRGGFIADGFPRNLDQLLRLPMLWRVDYAIQLWVDTQTSLDRLATRLNCPNCKAVYGPKKPPKKEGVCDNCGARLESRSDDAAMEKVVQRLKLYWSEMPFVLEYFRSGGVLTTINGDQPVEAIEAELARLVGA